jgi:hypothetical protein
MVWNGDWPIKITSDLDLKHFMNRKFIQNTHSKFERDFPTFFTNSFCSEGDRLSWRRRCVRYWQRTQKSASARKRKLALGPIQRNAKACEFVFQIFLPNLLFRQTFFIHVGQNWLYMPCFFIIYCLAIKVSPSRPPEKPN